ncbi:MAG: hypothetical protein QOJ52_3561 [Acidimicrobiaceae bacterium]|nr:hypothetical protein [Acidimicrobiaceae bacterium]
MSETFGSGASYSPMPPEPTGRPATMAPPPPVLTAVRLMLVRAALGVVGLVVLLATKDSLRAEILKKNRSADAARLDSLVNAAIAVGVVFGVIFLVLYALLALQGVRKGRNWARIVTMFWLASFAQAEPALSRVVTFLTAVIDVAIIVFLTQRPSRDFFRPAA